MKRFVKRILLFIVVYVVFGLIISAFAPYHWGNPWYSTKIQYLEREDLINYNTYFFGSSLVYRQISPTIFDSILNEQRNESSRSFNLGAPATFNPEIYYLYEQFLQSSLSKNSKYCFLELREIDLLDDYFLHQERITYWQNLKDLSFVFKSLISNPNLGYHTKINSFRNYLISYFENILHLGHFGKQLITPNYYNTLYLGENGFFSLEQEYLTTQDPIVKNNLLERKNSIIEKPELLEERKIAIKKAYDLKSSYIDKVNLQRISDLIQKSKEKGIHLTFILTPRSINSSLLNLSSKIPANNIIDLANPEKYESLYTEDNSFDVAHLNSKGAKIFTEYLANCVKEKNAQKHNDVYLK